MKHRCFIQSSPGACCGRMTGDYLIQKGSSVMPWFPPYGTGMRSETDKDDKPGLTTFRGVSAHPLFIAGRPNHEQSPLPLLTVLLFIMGEHRRSWLCKNEETGPLRYGHLWGLLAQEVPPDVLVAVLGEIRRFRKTFLIVPGSSIWTPNLRLPSPLKFFQGSFPSQSVPMKIFIIHDRWYR